MSESDSVTCSKCNKVCKDKRGMRIHEARCTGTNLHQCIGCECSYQSAAHLKRHQSTCDRYKEIQLRHEFAAKEEEYKRQIEEILKEKRETDRFCDKRIEMILNESDKRANEMQLKYKDLEDQLKKISEENVGLREKNDSLLLDYRRTVNINDTLRLSQQGSNIQTINQTYNNHQLVLQVFNYNDCSSKIKPPEITAYSTKDVVNLLFDSGFGNSIRTPDRSRKVILWNNPQGELIRDSNGSQLCQFIMSCFETTMNTQHEYLEQKLERLRKAEELDTESIILNQKYLDFCRKFKEKDPKVIDQLSKEIIKRVKDVNDSSVDPIKQNRFGNLISHINKEIFPRIDQWINCSLQEFGHYIATKMSDLYWIEGASQGSKDIESYIIVRDDHKQNIKITKKELGEILHSVLSSKIFVEQNQDVINRLVESWFIEKNPNKANDSYKQYTNLIKIIKQKQEKGIKTILSSMIAYKEK